MNVDADAGPRVAGPTPTASRPRATLRLRWLVPLVYIVALLPRVAFVLEVAHSPYVTVSTVDARGFEERALRILAGRPPVEGAFFQDPLYPYVLAGLMRLAGPGSTAVLVCQAALDALTPVLLLWLGVRLFGVRAGVFGGLLCAIYPVFWFYDCLLLKTWLSVLLSTASLVLLVEVARAPTWGRWVAAGAGLGLAALTRGNYLLLAPLFALWAAWQHPEGRGRFLAVPLCMALGFCAAISPVTIWNYRATGELIPTTSHGGQNLYLGNNPYNQTGTYFAPPFLRPSAEFEEVDLRREAERRAGHPLTPNQVSRFWAAEAIRYVRAMPRHFLAHLGRKALLFVNRFEVPDNQSFGFFREHLSTLLRLPLPGFAVVFPLALVGLFAAWAAGKRASLLPLFVIGYAATVVAFFNFSRYRLPVVPALCLLAGVGILYLHGLARSRRWRALAVGLAACVGASLVTHLDLMRDDPALYRYNLAHELHRLADAAERRAQAGEPAAVARQADVERLRRQALEALEIGYRERPGLRDLRDELVYALSLRVVEAARRGDLRGALRTAEEAVSKVPEHADAHFYLAMVLRDLGRPTETAAALRRALRLAPGHAKARRELLRLAATGSGDARR